MSIATNLATAVRTAQAYAHVRNIRDGLREVDIRDGEHSDHTNHVCGPCGFTETFDDRVVETLITQTGHPTVRFDLQHRYGDGAWALITKALARLNDETKKEVPST